MARTSDISYALRHGQATEVELPLPRGEAEEVLFTISDDGKGFDPWASHRRGHGHANLECRATAWKSLAGVKLGQAYSTLLSS